MTFLWQHSCCYGKVCINIKRCCQTACLHWDIQTLEGGKSAKIFYTVRKRNVWLIIVLLRRKPQEIHLYLMYAPLFKHQNRARPKTAQSCLQILQKHLKIQMVWQESSIITGVYVYSQKRKHDKAQKDIFSVSVIPKKLHWLYWVCRTFGNVPKAYESRK